MVWIVGSVVLSSEEHLLAEAGVLEGAYSLLIKFNLDVMRPI
jgi:hypothetical protein